MLLFNNVQYTLDFSRIRGSIEAALSNSYNVSIQMYDIDFSPNCFFVGWRL